MHDKVDECRIIGVKSNPIDYESVAAQLDSWIALGVRYKYIVMENVFTIMNAYDDSYYRRVIEESSLSIPDGKPIVLVNRAKGFYVRRQIRGSDLMYRYILHTAGKGVKHFFYGGGNGVAGQLKAFFEKTAPEVLIAGTCSPPFRPLTAEEDDATCALINESGAHVLWVALGSPKQDLWMYEHRSKLSVNVQIGVGAAFDFWTNNISMAPRWMQDMYLEWLYRLIQEPRRLFRRYMYHNPRYLYHCARELLRVGSYEATPGPPPL